MAGSFQLAQIDSELLIKEIKTRPCLYARDADKYGDPAFRRTMWEEVASSIFGDKWKTGDADDRFEQVKLVQRRWKNLRACFGREIKLQKDPKYIYGIAYKRRKYVYYNEMSFLKSEFDVNDTDESQDNSIDLPEKNEADDTTITVDTNIEEVPIVEAMPVMRKNVPKIVNETPIIANKTPTIEPNTSRNDSDSTNFALSLVPLLNMLPTHKRIDAQIMLLTVLKRFHQDTNEVEKKARKPKRTYGKRESETNVTVVIKSEAESDEDYD